MVEQEHVTIRSQHTHFFTYIFLFVHVLIIMNIRFLLCRTKLMSKSITINKTYNLNSSSSAILVISGVLLLSWAALAGRYSSHPDYYVLDGENLQMQQEMVDGETRLEDTLSRQRRYLLLLNNSLVQVRVSEFHWGIMNMNLKNITCN